MYVRNSTISSKERSVGIANTDVFKQCCILIRVLIVKVKVRPHQHVNTHL